MKNTCPVLSELQTATDAVRDRVNELFDRTMAEPMPGPYAVARALIEVNAISERLDSLIALLGGE